MQEAQKIFANQSAYTAQAAQAAQATQAAQAAQATPVNNVGNPRMRGFGKALTATILGFVGMIFAIVVYFAGLMSLVDYYYDVDAALGFLILDIIATVPSIIALAFGISSIKTFKSTPANQPKPIATLILGIGGVSLGGFSLFYCIITVFLIFGIMAI